MVTIEPAVQEPNSGRLRVLVVDDELLIRWSIAEALTRAGHTVIEAQDGATALQALAGRPAAIDAVLLDLRLPDSRGLTLLANIRHRSPEVPVILMTAHGTPEVTRGALDLGVYQVMNKPVEMQQVTDLLAAACSSRPAEEPPVS